MNIDIQQIAKDLAMEIVLGCDRFDKNDFVELINEQNVDKDQLKILTLDIIKKEFQDNDTGYGIATDDFVNRQIDYWFDF